MRAVVTGGAGFIGSHLTERLVRDGHQVTVVDSLVHGREANLAAAMAGGAQLVRHPVTGPDLPGIFAQARPEVVFHLAAQIDVRVSVADPVLDASSNVVGTAAVLEAARRAGARKVVLASSVAIYGPPDTLPVTERTPERPLSPYAVSKLAAEMYLRQYQQLHDLAGTALVLTNTYGPRQDPGGEAGVIAIFAAGMLAGRPTRVFGDGGNVRDYLYVDDAVEAFVRAADPAADGLRINVGTGRAVTDLELHRGMARLAGHPGPPGPEPEFAPARLGDLPAMVVDATRAAEVLGWKPAVELDEGLARTLNSLRG
ncbi:MAG: NAD-dependent epimerase/dehydratase family protein [Micromonosporaceae bacterium]|nr:NAD-dependent epimerase/dehydratase family protein [Micromonosporaceae bacterium]